MSSKPILAAAMLVAAALLSVSCSDSTGPKRPQGVTVSITSPAYPSPNLFVLGDTAQAINCNPKFTAIGHGTGQANWIGAKVYWYFGPDRKVADDSATISGDEVANAWGNTVVWANDTTSSTWTFSAGLPFSATMIFRYSREASDTSATVSFTCGPPPDTTPARPAFDLPTIAGPAGDLQPGDTIQVTLHATAGAGLWESLIALTGACQYSRQFPEALQGAVTRTVAIVIPASCRLKSDLGSTDLGITLAAIDPMGRVGSRSFDTGRWIVDGKPPTVSPSPRNLDGVAQWFVGDTLPMRFNATDNHALAALYWRETISGMGDSIVTQGTRDTATRRVVVPAAWQGQARVRFWARDAVGLTSDTVDAGIAPIPVAPIVTRAGLSAQIDGVADDAAYDVPRDMLYLAEPGANRVVFVSLTSMSVTRTVDIPGGPVSLDLTPSGDSLVVAVRYDPSLSIIDLLGAATAAPTRIPIGITPSSGEAPLSVRVMANGKAFVALGGYSYEDSSIVEVDVASGTQRVRGDARRPHSAYTLQRSGDHRVLVVNDGCLERYDVSSDAFSPCTVGPDWTAPVVADGTGATVAASLRIYDASLAPQRIVYGVWGINAGLFDPLVTLSPDGATLYAIDPRHGVLRASTASGATLDAAPYAGPPPTLLRVTPNGQTLFLIGASQTATTITLMDLR